jgi:hypothetical protein
MSTGPIECRQCEKKMERDEQVIMLTIRPTSYKCPSCEKRVLLYAARPAQAVSGSFLQSILSAILLKKLAREQVLKIWSDEYSQRGDITTYARQRAADKGLVLVQ